jgi:deazaflavin-dependent oxidoreductase (nitroreductase family)
MDLTETNKRVIEQFRAGGEIQGMHRERLVLLTTTGARTGARRTTPMMLCREDKRIFVIASNSGATRAPSWYTNLVADPKVTVEVGDETFEATAVPLEGEDRERTWTTIKAAFPFFAEHERKAGRTIPVVELRRSEGARRG